MTDSIERFMEVMRKVKEASSEMSEADVDAVTDGAGVTEVVTIVSITASIAPTLVIASSSAAACGM